MVNVQVGTIIKAHFLSINYLICSYTILFFKYAQENCFYTKINL